MIKYHPSDYQIKMIQLSFDQAKDDHVWFDKTKNDQVSFNQAINIQLR